jgi:hypothetical protein
MLAAPQSVITKKSKGEPDAKNDVNNFAFGNF